MNVKHMLCLSALILFMVACGSEKQEKEKTDKSVEVPIKQEQIAMVDTLENGEAKRIELQHILISFAGTRTAATRTQAEAQLLAAEVLGEAQSGQSFSELMKKYSDDTGSGQYALRNNGVQSDPSISNEYARGQMVPAFGNTGFKLDVGEIDMANFSKKDSPFGWHIIKRVR